MKLLKNTLVGVGQIFLQENGFTGLIICIAMFFSHWILGVSCFLGAFIGTLQAKILNYPEQQIKQGLYGFNASLAFMCTMFTFGKVSANSPLIWVIGVIASIVSTLIMRLFLQKGWVAFTFPFVLTCWVFCWGISKIHFLGLEQTTPALFDYTDIHHLISHPFFAWAEVNFGSNLVTGILIFIAVAINSPTTAMWATAVSVFASMIADSLFNIESNQLANGLYSFSSILVACAFVGPKLRDFMYVIVGVVLSIIIQFCISQIGLATYTVGFILASWIMLMVKAQADKVDYISNKLVKKLNP